MPNNTIPAAAEGMPTENAILESTATDADRLHPLGFETEQLPLEQLRMLSDALTTIGNVTSALQEWPAFSKNDCYTAAGGILDDLRDKIGWEIDAIRSIAEERKVASPDEAEAKFDIIIASMTWVGETPTAVAAKLASLASELDVELTGKEGGAS